MPDRWRSRRCLIPRPLEAEIGSRAFVVVDLLRGILIGGWGVVEVAEIGPRISCEKAQESKTAAFLAHGKRFLPG